MRCPDEVVDALDFVAGGAGALDHERFGDNVIPSELLFRAAIDAFFLALDELLILAQNIRPAFLVLLEIKEGLLDKAVGGLLGIGAEGALGNNLGVLKIDQVANRLHISVRHGDLLG